MVPELDFSALNNLSVNKDIPYRLNKRPSEPLKSTGDINIMSAPGQALKRKIEAFNDVSGTRNYNDIYRAAHECHRRHNPPLVDLEYWRTHTAGDDPPPGELEYWRGVYEDILKETQKQKDDPFLIDLMVAVYMELEREYTAIRGTI